MAPAQGWHAQIEKCIKFFCLVQASVVYEYVIVTNSHAVTVAILAQGTSLAVAAKQAFLAFHLCVCVSVLGSF